MRIALPFAYPTGPLSRRIALGLLAFFLLAARPASAQTHSHGPSTGKPNPQLTMVIAKRGTIVIELYPNAAPKTVAHIVKLVDRKFYDGLLFHRVIKEFVAQTGDPKSKSIDGAKLRGLSDIQVAQKFALGNGGSGKTVPLEPKLAHERGTVGLARSADIDSGDSQFFFNLKANHNLDSAYCVFGKVIKGLDVMDKIELGDRLTSLRVTAGK
ncbi:MAG: Peptidyl-prolyl cis-trans isomerase (rotamase)-cyclophilin family [Chthonomonadaceae bacterium]|nr:Peptidyl-prolyl cis-trans isomerase (rotamase)-cyclophilin family [Chthonomonadaceae bacterium]